MSGLKVFENCDHMCSNIIVEMEWDRLVGGSTFHSLGRWLK